MPVLSEPSTDRGHRSPPDRAETLPGESWFLLMVVSVDSAVPRGSAVCRLFLDQAQILQLVVEFVCCSAARPKNLDPGFSATRGQHSIRLSSSPHERTRTRRESGPGRLGFAGLATRRRPATGDFASAGASCEDPAQVDPEFGGCWLLAAGQCDAARHSR